MIAQRYEDNPILEPSNTQSWEAEAVYNGCPARYNRKTFLLYRALSKTHYHELGKTKMMVSNIGIADSLDGIHFKNRRRFIIPEHEWEKYGCEDPRVTRLDDKYYIFYTALSTYPFSAEGIKVGLAITSDFKKIDEKHNVTPFNAKGMTIFPEKINGRIWGMLSVDTDKPPTKICLVHFDKQEDMWSEKFWSQWYEKKDGYSLNLLRSEKDHIEVGSPPIKTKHGWLIFYSYIQNYFTAQPVFTIEAALLNFADPTKIIARTDIPVLNTQEYYEKIGLVPNIVFPSGAILKNDIINLYYGAADTFCCVASINYKALLDHMFGGLASKIQFERSEENPIISPIKENAWESKAVYNPASIYANKVFHIVYRAQSEDNTSVFGYATTRDGVHIEYRSPQPIYIPREPFEQKNVPNGNSGCEDPRLTAMGNKIYMCYTAFDSINVPRVALTWIKRRDFLERKWEWSKPVLISPPNLDDKDAFVFPQKVNGKYIIVHRHGEDIDLAFCKSLNFGHDEFLEEYRWIQPRKGWWDSKRIGAASPVVKTKDGWIMLYHGISDDGIYRLGALLLDLKDPTKIIGRTDEPIFEPVMYYEKVGQVDNVVFPCGANVKKKFLYIFYGGADLVIGVARIKTKKLLDILKKG